jgi:DNA-binding transcriptional LysR family regulator
MPDLDLRLVRYFTAVAEHLNFARAAEALHVAQPSLSRQIQRLESTLGVRLLERTNQGSHLTAAGEAFLPRAQTLLHQAQEAARAAQGAAPARTVTIGYVEDLVITRAVRDLRRRRPEAYVRTRHLTWHEAGVLVEGGVDALVVRAPLTIPTDGLDITVLYEESGVLVLPATHRLAGERTVDVGDLHDEPLIACTSAPSTWTGFWRLLPRPDGGSTSLAPLIAHAIEDKLEIVADGRAIALLSENDPRLAGRDDIATVPVSGIDPYEVVVATRSGEENPLVDDFVEAARATLGR